MGLITRRHGKSIDSQVLIYIVHRVSMGLLSELMVEIEFLNKLHLSLYFTQRAHKTLVALKECVEVLFLAVLMTYTNYETKMTLMLTPLNCIPPKLH